MPIFAERFSDVEKEVELRENRTPNEQHVDKYKFAQVLRTVTYLSGTFTNNLR